MRDKYSQTVADNISAILAQRGVRRNAIKGSGTSTAIYDFLASETASVRVGTLGKWAEFLEMPITAFLIPPDKRDAVLGFLRTLDTDGSIQPDQAGELVAELLRMSKAEEGFQSADELGTSSKS